MVKKSRRQINSRTKVKTKIRIRTVAQNKMQLSGKLLLPAFLSGGSWNVAVPIERARSARANNYRRW